MPGVQQPLVHPVGVVPNGLQQPVDQRFREEVRLQAEVEELRVLRVVVVLLHLRPGVGDVLDDRLPPQPARALRHLLGQLLHRELLGELVEHPVLAHLGGVHDGQLHAGHGVSDVEEPAGLAALAVHGDGMVDGGLHAEPVQRGTPHVVVVEPRGQAGIHVGLFGADPVHHALVEVGGPDAPHPAHELDVVRVVHLRQVVEAARPLRVGQDVGASVVVDLDEALFDVDVRRSVLAHRPQLDQVRLRREVLHGEQDVQRPHDVVDLGDHGVAARQHRERRGPVLGVVHDRLGLEALEHVLDELPVCDVADERPDRPLAQAGPQVHPVLEGEDRDQGVGSDLVVPQATVEAIDDGDVVAPVGQMHRRRPAEVAVSAEYEDLHDLSLRPAPARGRSG